MTIRSGHIPAKTREEQIIDDQIAERKQQADEKNLFEKTKLIAEKLGEYDSEASYRDYDGSSTVNVFNDAATSLAISYTYSTVNPPAPYRGSLVEVSYKGEQVFRAGFDNSYFPQGVSGYVPGPWETQVNALYTKAQQMVKNEQAKAKQEAAQEKTAATRRATAQKRAEVSAKRKQWGLPR